MKKILFVDDETNLLEGLARMLRKKKDEWEMIFINSSQEALDWLEKNICDVIVTDYKMPGMDGIDLLRHVKDKYEGIKRVILSGQLEPEIYQKAKEISHTYISKPCNPDELIRAIENNK